MSRIGKAPVNIPEGVQVEISDKNIITVKGKLGELQQKMNLLITAKVEDNKVIVERKSEQKNHRALHGLTRALIQNMVTGVSEGYKIVQEVIGVGYKVNTKGQTLELLIGYSHNIFLVLPDEIKVETVTERGKNPLIILTSHDKQLLGQVAAKIRSLRKPEPYKGKGIRYQGEYIRKKAGKAAAE